MQNSSTLVLTTEAKIVLGRTVFFILFSIAYVLLLVNTHYINPYALEWDIKNYYHHFNYDGIAVFGFEFVVPSLFWLAKKLGFDFYEFTFLLGIFYLYPIYSLSRKVRIVFLPLYFLFFILYFVPNYIFLMRQYLSFFFLILFALSSSRISLVYLAVGLFSHISAVIIILAMAVVFNRRIIYLVVAVMAVLSFFLSVQLDLLSLFLRLVGFLHGFGLGQDLDRKLHGMLFSAQEEPSSSVLVYLVLSVSILLHSFYMYKRGGGDAVMNIFFFSSCLALFFSASIIVSNRLGFAGYFFSVPYLAMVLSLFSVSRKAKVRFM